MVSAKRAWRSPAAVIIAWRWARLHRHAGRRDARGRPSLRPHRARLVERRLVEGALARRVRLRARLLRGRARGGRGSRCASFTFAFTCESISCRRPEGTCCSSSSRRRRSWSSSWLSRAARAFAYRRARPRSDRRSGGHAERDETPDPRSTAAHPARRHLAQVAQLPSVFLGNHCPHRPGPGIDVGRPYSCAYLLVMKRAVASFPWLMVAVAACSVGTDETWPPRRRRRHRPVRLHDGGPDAGARRHYRYAYDLRTNIGRCATDRVEWTIAEVPRGREARR